MTYLNHYCHEDCPSVEKNVDWSQEGERAISDTCPECGVLIEPYENEEISA